MCGSRLIEKFAEDKKTTVYGPCGTPE